jgi:putative membrane protein
MSYHDALPRSGTYCCVLDSSALHVPNRARTLSPGGILDAHSGPADRPRLGLIAVLAATWQWTLDPFEIAGLALAVWLYIARRRTLAGRRAAPPWWRAASYLFGIVLIASVLISPVDSLGEYRSFLMHMIQHLVLGDVAPLFIVIGMTGPMLRPILALPLVDQLRVLGHPVPALGLWSANLYAWHTPGLYQLALEHDTVHIAEHILYVLFGCIMWAAIFEPLPGPRWFTTGYKVLYVLGMRVIEGLLANILMWSQSVFYPHYLHVVPLFGLSPHEEQSLGGVAMLLEGGTTSILVLGWFFYRFLADGETRDELVRMGVPLARADRAVRYGRGAELRDRISRLQHRPPAGR